MDNLDKTVIYKKLKDTHGIEATGTKKPWNEQLNNQLQNLPLLSSPIQSNPCLLHLDEFYWELYNIMSLMWLYCTAVPCVLQVIII